MPSIANMTVNGNSGERGILLRRGTGAFIYNSYVTGSASCLEVSGESLALLGTGIVFDGVSLGCPVAVSNNNVETQTWLDRSNVDPDWRPGGPGRPVGQQFLR